jgi:ethanolamine ammonia-lyase small subunit
MIHDPWSQLREQTTARVALGRAGGSLPTAAVLAFAADHAAARDAVYSELDVPALQSAMAPLGLPTLVLRTQATDRQSYLQRPDLGRKLDTTSVTAVQAVAGTETDIALIVADGLSALATQSHAADVLANLIPRLRGYGFRLAPLSIVTQARVAVQDQIGSLLHARVAVILIGERPGLGSADSVGAYLVHNPVVGNTDADRNCVSNIRPQQLSPAAAANTLAWLIEQSLVRRISGVRLKDESAPAGLSRIEVVEK